MPSSLLPFSHLQIPRLLAISALFVLSLGLAPATASAFSFQGQVYGGAGIANLNQAAPTAAGWWGPSLHTGLVIDLGDFFRATADIQGSYHFQRTIDENLSGPHAVFAAALGARYVFDVVSYVPYVGLSLVAYPMEVPGDSGELFGLRATIGMDYRHNRRWSYGAAAELSTPLLEPANFPLYSSLRAHVAFHFRRF